MDPLDLAIRQYRRIVPQSLDNLGRTKLRELQAWLADDVCPVLQNYVRRPAFREHASWVLRTLRSGVDTPERQQIDAVDSALVRCARLLSSLASKQRIGKQLAKSNPPRNHVVSEEIVINGQGAHRVARTLAPLDNLQIEISQVAAMVRRPWGDLVNPLDYFEPIQEFIELDDGKRIQRGEFIVALNPQLHPVGNFVVRCLLRRIDIEHQILTSLRRKILNAVATIGRSYRDAAALEEAWQALEDDLAALRVTHQTGAGHSLRDSCMILTQVYGAFDPSPDLTWLDVPQERIDQSIPPVKLRIRGLHNGEMFDRIATALGHLKQLYAGDSPQQSAIEEAIVNGGLVIDKAAQNVWWEGQKLQVDWVRFGNPWKFLLALARKATHGAAITETDVFGDETVSASTMGTNAERLRKNLPPSLRKHIVPGGEPRTYRLEVESHRIHLL